MVMTQCIYTACTGELACGMALYFLRLLYTRICLSLLAHPLRVAAATKQKIREKTRAAMNRPEIQAKIRRPHQLHSEATKVRN